MEVGEVVFFFEFNQWIIIVTLYFTVYSDTYCESSDMCRDENLDDVHSIKNGRFHEWYEDYKMSDWIEVGPVEALIKVRMLGAPNGRMFPNMLEMPQMVFFYALEACFVNLELP